MARNTTDLVPVWRKHLATCGQLRLVSHGTYLGVPDEFRACLACGLHDVPAGISTTPTCWSSGCTWSDFFVKHSTSVASSSRRDHLTPERLQKLRTKLALSERRGVVAGERPAEL
jgi:alpha-galactosidase